MFDKTRLEQDIERQEMDRAPFGVGLLIALLTVALSASGIYIYKLKQEIAEKEQEITRIREDFQEEKRELLRRIRQRNDLPDARERRTEIP